MGADAQQEGETMMSREIETGSVYEIEDGRYAVVDTSWDNRGVSGIVDGGRVVHNGSASALRTIEVDGLVDGPVDIRGASKLELRQGSRFGCYTRCVEGDAPCYHPDGPENCPLSVESTGCAHTARKDLVRAESARR
jgi:hypothetical protein